MGNKTLGVFIQGARALATISVARAGAASLALVGLVACGDIGSSTPLGADDASAVGGAPASGGSTGTASGGGGVGPGGAKGVGGIDGTGGGQAGGNDTTVASAMGGKVGNGGASGVAGAGGLVGGGGSGPVGAGGTGTGTASKSGATGGGSGSGTGGQGPGGRGTGGQGPGGSGTGGRSGGNGGGGAGSGGQTGGGPGGNGTGGSGTGGVGAGGSGQGGSSVGGSSGATLAALADAFCAAARSCCTKAALPSTLGDCEAKFETRLPALAFVNKGSEVIDSAALAACIAGYKQTATTCAFNPLATACQGVFVGTKAEGAPCGVGGIPMTTGSGECKATGRGEMCLWTGDANVSTTTGVCRALVHGKKGDPCATSCPNNDDCAFDLLTSPGYPTATCFESDGLYCTGSPSPVCAPIVAAGGSCEADMMACASNSYCDTSVTPAVCRVAGILGQACSTSGTRCGQSLMCGTDNKCDDLGFAYDTTCGGTPPFPL